MKEDLQYNSLKFSRFSASIPNKVVSSISDKRIRSYKDSDYDSLSFWMNDLGKFYDGHDEKNKLIDQLVGREEEDSGGFFTKNKFMFVCEVDNKPAGMICLNYKRGGSAKMGPIIVNPEIRGQGIGHSLLNTIEEIAITSNIRKLYGTTSHLNYFINNYLQKAHYKIEAEFPNQYKKGSTELIWGKHIMQPNNNNNDFNQSILVRSETIGSMIMDTNNNQYLNFINQVNEVYKQWHDDLGSDFIEGMILGAERSLSFQSKGKIIFIAKDEEKEKGMMTFTPKRGGSVKLYPIYGTVEAQKSMIENAKKIARQNKNHKFYTFIHVSDTEEIEFLKSIGFSKRGLIESPYKMGHDLVGLDMFIK